MPPKDNKSIPPKHNKGYFSRSKDKILIEMVRMNSVLYDDGHDNFRDPVMKHLIWENISAAIDVPIPIVKKRWRHFRDHYLKKCRDRTAGAGRGRQTWEYMERLDFLAFLTRGRRPASPGSPDPAAVKQSVIYVMPPGEHDSFSEPEDAEPAGKRTRQAPDAVVCCSPDADELQPRAAAYSDAPRYSTCIPLMGTPVVGEERSAVHKFFESMADLVAELPAPLVAEARLRVCKLVNELETRSQQAGAGAACPRCHPPPQPDP